MNEEKYRLYKAFLLTVLVVGILVFGFQYISLYSQQVQTGRFVQYDLAKEYAMTDSFRASIGDQQRLIDTQTGAVYEWSGHKLINIETGKEYKP